jgi:hypothetical protein
MNDDIFERLHPGFTGDLSELLKRNGFDVNVSIKDEEDCKKRTTLICDFARGNLENIDDLCKELQRDKGQGDFLIEYYQVWGHCLQLSIMHHRMLEDTCRVLKVPFDEEHIKEAVLLQLMGKGLQTYAEIITLLTNGYPYGAVALARNLFELMVVIQFMAQENEAVAMAHYEASQKPLDQQNEKKKYEWARKAGCIGENEAIHLKLLQEKCGMTDPKYKEIFSYHCKFAHASPQTVNLDAGASSNMIFTGCTMVGIEGPAINSALFISSMMVTLVNHFKHPEFRLGTVKNYAQKGTRP